MTEMTGINGMDHDFRHARHNPIPSGSSPRGHSGIVDSAGVIAHKPELFLSSGLYLVNVMVEHCY